MLTNSLRSLRHAAVCGVITATAVFCTPTFAASHDDPARTVTVRYADLDLSKDKDVAKLYRRLQSASRAVCRSLRGTELASLTRYKECYANALADAVDTIDVRTLTALHKRPSENRA